tara:strand:+ start:68 stop:379 length:312 start_codon:yes stop_codon:yes gene_type:complete
MFSALKSSLLGNIVFLNSFELSNNSKKELVPLNKKLDPSKVTPAYSTNTNIPEIKNVRNCECDKIMVFLSSLEDVVVYCSDNNKNIIKKNPPNYDLYHKYFEF